MKEMTNTHLTISGEMNEAELENIHGGYNKSVVACGSNICTMGRGLMSNGYLVHGTGMYMQGMGVMLAGLLLPSSRRSKKRRR